MPRNPDSHTLSPTDPPALLNTNSHTQYYTPYTDTYDGHIMMVTLASHTPVMLALAPDTPTLTLPPPQSRFGPSGVHRLTLRNICVYSSILIKNTKTYILVLLSFLELLSTTWASLGVPVCSPSLQQVIGAQLWLALPDWLLDKRPAWF